MVTSYFFAQLLPSIRGGNGSLLVLGSANVDECTCVCFAQFSICGISSNADRPARISHKVESNTNLFIGTRILSLPQIRLLKRRYQSYW